MEYFNKMDPTPGYMRAGFLGLTQGFPDSLRLHPAAFTSQMTDKDSLLRPFSDYSTLPMLSPFSGPHYLPHHIDHRLPFSASAFHPIPKIPPPTTNPLSSSATNTSLSNTLPSSAFAAHSTKSSKLQPESPITSTTVFGHNFMASLEQHRAFLGGPSPTSIPGSTNLDDRRDSPSPIGSHRSRESPGQARDLSSPTSPSEDIRARKVRSGGDCWCPICMCGLRAGEVESHLTKEIDQLLILHRKRSSTPNTMHGVTSRHSPSIGRSQDQGWDTFQRVKANRQNRLKAKKRRAGREELDCPICNERIPANTQTEFQLHMADCLRRQNGTEDEDIDVEGDSPYDDNNEYLHAKRPKLTILRAQHLTGCNKDDAEISSEKEVTSATPDKGSGCDSGSTDCEKEVKMSDLLEKECESLKEKLRSLEREAAISPVYQCQICHNTYDRPSISTKCWHVFCENCWPHGINIKEECPQCSQPYSADDIRQIHL